MSVVDQTQHVPKASKVSALLDFLQAASGLALVLFMWSHMGLVSSVLIGEWAMDGIAEFFEKTYLVQTGGPIVGIGFMVHFVLAARKVPFQLHERRSISAHVKMLSHTDTKLWLIQAGSAMIILFMGFAHMWEVLTNLPITAGNSAYRIQGGFWGFFYLILLPLVELHVGIGLYRMAMKWGFVGRRGRKPWHAVENLITAFFITLGLASLYTFWFVVEATPPGAAH